MEYGVGTRVGSNCTVDAFISSSSVVVVDRAAQREKRAREKEREKGRERKREREAPFFGAELFLNFSPFSLVSKELLSLVILFEEEKKRKKKKATTRTTLFSSLREVRRISHTSSFFFFGVLAPFPLFPPFCWEEETWKGRRRWCSRTEARTI